ncbi:MAG TPA: hypothetical protein VJ740_15150, partial [Hyphomicrobiaceae bacterium]|nr:hypothetical protein [Hyphomicrobiaceae bacterium]
MGDVEQAAVAAPTSVVGPEIHAGGNAKVDLTQLEQIAMAEQVAKQARVATARVRVETDIGSKADPGR